MDIIKCGNFSAIISSIFPPHFISIHALSLYQSLLIWDSNMYIRSLKTVLLPDTCGFLGFISCVPLRIVFITTSSSLLIFSSTMSNLLLNPVQRIFLVSDTDYIFISRNLMLDFLCLPCLSLTCFVLSSWIYVVYLFTVAALMSLSINSIICNISWSVLLIAFSPLYVLYFPPSLHVW